VTPLAPAILALAAGAGPECILVRDREPAASVRAESPSAAVGFAASELRRYVKAMSGADLHGSGGACAVTIALDPSLGWDAFTIEVTEGAARVTGGTDRGALYGAYQILEDLGCRFLAPGPEGENVPQARTLSLRAGSRRHQPALRYRGLIVQEPLSERNLLMADWMAKNRMNYWVNPWWSFEKADAGLRQRFVDALEDRGILWEFGHHTFEHWIGKGPRDETVLGLIAGRRSAAGICVSNPKAVEKVAENMSSFTARWPQTDVLSLWPSDDFRVWCECEGCRALYGKLPESRWHGPLMSRPYAWFLGRVAERLSGLGVTQPISLLAYNATLEPAEGSSFPDNVLVAVAPIGRDYTRPLASLEYFGPIMDRWNGLLGGRSPKGKAGARVMAYEYYAGMYAQNSLPFPTVTALSDDIARHQETGFGGITTQAEEGHWGTYGLNLYAQARMSYHGREDPATLIAGFCRDYYGPAAAPMTAYWTRQEDLIRSQAHVPPAGQFFHVLRNTPREIEKLDGLVAQAEALADTDTVKGRVHLTRLSIDYVKLLRDAMDAAVAQSLEALPPTPKGKGHLPAMSHGDFVQLRFPVPREGDLEVSFGNIVPETGAGMWHVLEARRDAKDGAIIHTGKIASGSAEEAARHSPGRAWAAGNRKPVNITPHLTAADRQRGWVDLFVTARVIGDRWTLYRDHDDGGPWDIKVHAGRGAIAPESTTAWLRLKAFVERHSRAGIFNKAPDYVLTACRKMMVEAR